MTKLKNRFLCRRALACARAITPAWVVVSAVLALSSAAIAQHDDGDSGWGKPKAKEPAKPTAKTPPSGESDKDRIKREGQGLFTKPGAAGGAAGDVAEGGAKGWAVVIAAFRGEGREQAAMEMLGKLRSEGLPEAYAARRRESVIVAVGDFADSTDAKAQAELARIRTMEINGVKPYAGAMFAPPLDWKMTGGSPQYSLARAKEMYGDRALYTLQVAAYGRSDLPSPTQEDLAECRKAAEEAVARLRQEGEQAFYYHARSMSMVTVGIFDTTDFDPQAPRLNSSRLREAKKKHPNNLYNGQGIRERHKDGSARMQTSQLVEIPRS